LTNLLKTLCGGAGVTEIAIRMVGERELLVCGLCDVFWCIRADPEDVEGVEDALTKDHRAAARATCPKSVSPFLPAQLSVFPIQR
jgi:hypothetical protein